jgi:hypothetical protein
MNTLTCRAEYYFKSFLDFLEIQGPTRKYIESQRN